MTAVTPALMTVLAVLSSDPPPPRNAISAQVGSLFSSGLTLQYEREVVRRLSLVNSLSYRFSGGDEFDTREVGGGFEGRFWFVGRGMIGPYAGLRFDYSFTRVSEGDRFLGSSMSYAESVVGGVRFMFWRRLEATPQVGIGVRQELDPRGRLEPQNHLDVLRLGLTLGVMF
ncbi:MAG: hypothetical protein U0270_05350 [Labilithrix sp.]